MTLRITRASGESVVVVYRDRPDSPPLRLRVSERHEPGFDTILIEVEESNDYIVLRSDLYDRPDFDLTHFLEK